MKGKERQGDKEKGKKRKQTLILLGLVYIRTY
jgi:hypothetical protein